jgi:CRISPR-associated endonuclease Csn1
MTTPPEHTTILGLDLGATSIGWAVIACQDGDPRRILGTGVRIFEAAAGEPEKIESGGEVSPNAARRQARQIRRQLERRARRLEKHAGVLQRFGLLPEGDVSAPQRRHEFFLALDAELRAQHEDEASETYHHVFPYWLRARALDHKLEPYEIGRALYHLGQRRGFLSNRKTAAREKDEEKSKVYQGISELEKEMQAAAARTLGEYFAGLDPTDPEKRRIRHRWTSRKMYQAEFEAIWQAQAKHHPGLLTEQVRTAICEAIFHQRPLKLQKHLIGMCQFEYKGKHPRRRAPMALPIAQRFRILQKINDLKIVDPDFQEHDLTPDERGVLLQHLETSAELKFTQARRLLKLPKDSKFNLERGGEERLLGNRTSAKLMGIFGDRWQQMTPLERDRIVEDVRSFEKDDALARRGEKHYGLDPDTAKKFGAIEFEPGYCGLSQQAIEKLLPLMEQGIWYSAAAKQVYGGDEEAVPVELLPSVSDAIRQRLIPELRNPVVSRVLSELAKVVNAIIAKFGKPDTIRIELARDLKRPREQRKRISIKNRRNEKSRRSVADKIRELTGDDHPSRDVIERLLLHEECGGVCPYTGKPISEADLLSAQSQFDIEHIIPFSRCLDNSFLNKTLCHHEENRTVKRNKTPSEAYSGDRYEEIIARVKRFKRDARDEKLRRFLLTELEEFESFSSRMLNDTRYATTLAADYLGLLYGGQHRKHIQAATGPITAHLRDVWRLNKILGNGGIKSRDDHRHHAVDAIAIALTDPKTVKMLNQAAERADAEGRRRFASVSPPWDRFLEDVQETIHHTNVSHRVSRKVNGRLHEETFYSPQPCADDGKPCVHVRKPVDALTAPDLKEGVIVDPIVRKRITEKLDELGISDPKKAFADRKNHPYLETKTGRRIPIHKVRIAKVLTTFQVGKECRARHVTTDSNHHMEILEVKDKKGETRWEDLIVSQYEALQRLKNHQPIVNRNHGEAKRFLFSLASGDTVEVQTDEGKKEAVVIRSVSKDMITFARAGDARKKADIIAAEDWFAWRLNRLRNNGCRKVLVTPLGEVRRVGRE